MSHEEILETSDDGRFRVKLVLDECPPEPYDDGQSPLVRIESRSGTNAEHIMATGRPLDDDEHVEEAIARWGTPSSPDWRLVEKYLRAFFGVTKIETWNSGGYWYVTYDPERWREHVGAPAGSVDMSEYRAWCEGDVWGWVVEKLVHWTTEDGAVEATFKDEWEHLDSCWGYYGSDGANGDYLKSCAREALLDAQIEDHGGVFGPLPENQPAIWNRLEYLRGELRGQRISWSELHELQCLAAYIEPGDTELLEAAGVPEHDEHDEPEDRS